MTDPHAGEQPVESTPVVSDATALVSGRFHLGELLGTGGSASVFRAVDERTGSPVAVKILHPHLAERAVAREAFLAEARRAAPLRHRNIVGVLDVGTDDAGDPPIVWIALQIAPGSSLSEHVARHGPLAPAEAVAVADGVLRALEAAHASGLIHRDVSPSNVMVAPTAPGALAADGVRLLDFGLADAAGRAALGTDELLSVEAAGRSGVMGNVNYMSPEHVRGMPVDERGDVYQLGATLHFALTGRPPFPRSTTGQTMRAHLDTPPPVPSATNARVPRALDRIVVRALLKQPGDRFASAAEMRSAVVALPVPVARRASAPGERSEPAMTTHAAPVAAPPAAPAAAASSGSTVSPSAPEGVTRVLGRTLVPPRAAGAPGAAVAAPAGRGRGRPRAGGWLATVAAAVAIAVVVVFAATSEPTASAGPEPSAAPPPVTTTTPSPEPQPEPGVVPVSTVAVPELARLSVGEAVSALAGAGLAVGDVMLVDSPFPPDVVLDSNPAAGRRLAARAAVALIASTGANAIPDVAGRSRAEAAAAVQAAGFVPAFAARAAPAGTAPGSVVGTAPAAGTRLTVGETVTIHEADPEDLQPTPTITPTPARQTPTPTPTAGAGDG